MGGDEIRDAMGTPPGPIGQNSSDEARGVLGEPSTTGQANSPVGPSPANNPAQAKRWRRRLLTGALAAVFLAIAAVLGFPWVEEALNTVSTDDAYVNGHVTFVSARIPGQVSRVLVDNNNRVHQGDLLAELDKEPYQVIAAIKKAAVDTAKANLAAAEASVRGIEAKARSQHWKLQHATEYVDNQVKLLQAKIAALDKSKASLKLAEVEFERVSKLVVTGLAASHEQFDQRQAALSVAQADVTQALADIHQIRVSLGLPATPEKSGDLGQVPPDLNQTFSSVREAKAELIETAAELGVSLSYNQTPKHMIEEFGKRGGGNIDVALAQLVPGAPAVKQAKANVESAERDLDQAELNLSYCRIVADIDGVITSRNVNPGDDVLAGQGLMAIRSLKEIWVDANFKETQLRDLRIGQAADLYVDMYGGRHVFRGRITGFTMGTGSTLALLPPQNATGNFVKVVQRLPVRIELQDYNPDKAPLFIGLSVVPYVYLNKPPAGPDAGKFLQALGPQSQETFMAGSPAQNR